MAKKSKAQVNSWEQPCVDDFYGMKREPVHSFIKLHPWASYSCCVYCQAWIPDELLTNNKRKALL